MADMKEVFSGLADKTAGAAPVDTARSTSAVSNGARAASHKGNAGTLHWFAFLGQETHADPVQTVNCPSQDSNRLADSSLDGASQRTSASITDQVKDGGGLTQKEREERIRNLRDRQNEERARKLEELRNQALAAQKFREQKEEERRRRIEELRSRDNDRRYQVEERKRQIWEAERDRREAILRKNQEREVRVDTRRRNERSSIVFAFGSSTPRMLEPADTGGSFWGTRRATSTTNMMMFSAAAPLTRRSSERELDGSKKRAASASGLDRKPEEDKRMSTSVYGVFHWDEPPAMFNVISEPPPTQMGESTPNESAPKALKVLHLGATGRGSGGGFNNVRSAIKIGGGGDDVDSTPGYNARVNRKKTDLMPTIPSPRDTTPSRPPSSHSQHRPFSRSPGLRSGEVTPSPPSRPLSSMSQQSMTSVNAGGVSMRHRPVAAPRKPRPFSIAVTGVSQEHELRPASYRHSISGEIRTSKAMASSVERIDSAKPPLPKPHVTKKPATAHPKPDTPARRVSDRAIKSAKASPRATPKATPLQSPGTETAPPIIHAPQITPVPNTFEQPDTKKETNIEEAKVEMVTEANAVDVQPTAVNVDVIVKDEVILNPRKEETIVKEAEKKEDAPKPVLVDVKPIVVDIVKSVIVDVSPVVDVKPVEKAVEKVEIATSEKVEEEVDMTASMMAKTRISTEEQAKAALAERRRLAREQAEREAELERQRVEQERVDEEERLRLEEEEQVKFEEDQLRLVEEARKAEEERLLIAIQENEKQQEEDRKRREEDAKAKIEREEADKKAREEAEKQRQEMELRLKKEEEERVTRRKRVEAIMLRTRGKGNTPANTPTKDGDSEGDEIKDASPTEDNKLEMSQSVILTAASADNHVAGNGHNGDVVENGGDKTTMMPTTMSTSASSELLLIDNTNGKPMEISDEDLSERGVSHSNGHRNGVEYNNSVDFVNVDNMKQNKPSNNLLDFSEFETLSNDQSSTSTTDLEQIMTPTTGKFINEDNVNSNINAPFIAFSDNLTKRQDSNTVTDLLS